MPSRFTIDQNGILIIPDGGLASHRIQPFTLDGEFLGEWGKGIPEFICGLEHEFYYLNCD